MSGNRFNASRVAVYSKRPYRIARTVLLLLAAWPFVLAPNRAHAQAPSLIWSTNIGAQLFAADAQTNAYANAGATVIKLTGAGVPFQTNSICPRPGLAQRDAEGNYFFAGILPSHKPPGSVSFVFDPQDFGGVVLSNLAVYLAKYSPAGYLLWATNFGPSSVRENIAITDLQLDAAGDAYAGYTYNIFTTLYNYVLNKRGPDGADAWSVAGRSPH